MTKTVVTPFLMISLLSLFAFAGCSGSETADSGDESQETASTGEQDGQQSKKSPKRSFKPIVLGGGTAASSGDAENHQGHKHTGDDVLKAMQPLQILLGKWQGITRKTYEGFKAVDELQWIWDFKTDKDQPALVFTSDKSPYIRKGRLTYLYEDEKFQFTSEDKDGEKRTYTGKWKVEPQDVAGDNNKTQRTFKLELTEVADKSAKEAWQIVFNQQENNRYLMELARKRGSASFRAYDVVGTQRQGTSFALDDIGYGEKTCIISQGLGVIQVSHKGKSYWVCCSGCKAAFEDDPEMWLAKWETKQKEMEKK